MERPMRETVPIRSVLFVCLGNICRSPLAEGLFRDAALASGFGLSIVADSAGTSNWHAGEPPHRQSIAAAARRGIDISTQRSRQFTVADLDRFDVVLAMDARNLADIRRQGQGRAQTALFMEHAGLGPLDVPDPWGGDDRDYDRVATMIASACTPLVTRLAAAS